MDTIGLILLQIHVKTCIAPCNIVLSYESLSVVLLSKFCTESVSTSRIIMKSGIWDVSGRRLPCHNPTKIAITDGDIL